MQKKSLTPLSFILLSAFILFIIAVFWKYSQVDNSETVTINDVKENITKKITKDSQSTTPIKQEYKPEYKPDSKSVKETLNTREAIETHYKQNYFLARLRTPEDLVAAYKDLRNKGDYDMADKVLDKLEYVFPDYEFED